MTKMTIDFKKGEGLVPAIIQDAKTKAVLMLGYMNEEAFAKTKDSGKVTFFSRTKNRLWTKGEESGNFLNVVDIKIDCDQDTLLIKANPVGHTCHTGSDTCWNEKNESAPTDFLAHLEETIQNRKNNPSEKSYTSQLLARGINKVAQKVGEEAVELVIEAKDDSKELFLGEAADLMYHYIVLLAAKNYSFDDVVKVLKERHK
jgi:phosphoribosyl-ATP pyrophosphohydrolase/phosphoribosyl-AMP cyclohydrolase